MRWVVLLLLLAVDTTWAAPEEIVTAHLEWEPGTLGTVSQGRMNMFEVPTKGSTPPKDMQDPKYACIKMAGAKGGLCAAFDSVEDSPRLWIDHDFDRNLAGEKITHLKRIGTTWYRRQVILAPYDDEPEPVPVPIRFRHARKNGSHYVDVQVQIHRRGTVVLGGRLRFVALVDNSFDACFDDPVRDRIYLDLDGDGRFQAMGDNPPERILAGKPFRVGDEGWIARVTSKSGRAIEFKRTKAVPPAKPRTWPEVTPPKAGMARTPPAESLARLKKRFDGERAKPYAGRHATVTQIGFVGTRAAFDLLMKIATSDKDKNVRYAALRAFGNVAYKDIGGKKVAEMARKATNQTANSLGQALYYMGYEQRDAIFLEWIQSAEAGFVNSAARWLAASGTERGRKQILEVAGGHAVAAARYGAYVQGVRNLPGGPPVAVALKAARDDYTLLRAQGIKDLGVLGHPEALPMALAVAAARPVVLAVGLALADVLGGAGDARSVAALLSFLEDPKLHENLRKRVLHHLRFIRAPKSVAVIAAALGSKVPAIRSMAAEILGSIPEREITTTLLRRAKKEKDPEILRRLYDALGDHGDPIALAALLKRAKSRRKGPARVAAIRGLARLGFQLPKVRKFFLALLEARATEDRILALDAAAAAGDPGLMPKVVRSLGHEEWRVRLAAVEALDALRQASAIPPLIRRLEHETEERVRDEIAGVLFRHTGMNLYDNAKIWKQWWSKHSEGFEVPSEIPTLPEEHAGGTQAGFYGIPVRSERVIFVIDKSGSMGAAGKPVSDKDKDKDEKRLNRLEVATKEVLGAVAKLKSRARVNVILFHTTIEPWKPKLQVLSEGNRGALARHLKEKTPAGGTNLYDGLELALRAPDVDTIFLLSDGVPGAGKYVATPDILRAVRRENQTRRIAIHCVAIGPESDLLRRLARENGGRYVRR